MLSAKKVHVCWFVVFWKVYLKGNKQILMKLSGPWRTLLHLVTDPDPGADPSWYRMFFTVSINFISISVKRIWHIHAMIHKIWCTKNTKALKCKNSWFLWQIKQTSPIVITFVSFKFCLHMFCLLISDAYKWIISIMFYIGCNYVVVHELMKTQHVHSTFSQKLPSPALTT